MTHRSDRKNTAHLALDALERLAIEKGLDDVSMRDVAKRLGISLAALQYHYPTKAELLEAFLSSRIGNYIEKINEIMAGHPSEARLSGVLRYTLLLALEETEGGVLAMIEARAHYDKTAADAVARLMSAWIKELQRVVGEEYPDMTEQQSLHAATLIVSLIDGACTTHKTALDLGANKDAVIDTLLRVASSVPDAVLQEECA